jgi:hypothetical protein
MAKKMKLVQRDPQEVQALYIKLMTFLLENPDYQYVEDTTGLHIAIPAIKIVEDSGIITPPKKSLITK